MFSGAEFKRHRLYWFVIAGTLVLTLLVIAGALVISAAERLFIMSLVNELLTLSELTGGSLDTELVEFDSSIEFFPQPTRNIIANRGIIVFILFLSLMIC